MSVRQKVGEVFGNPDLMSLIFILVGGLYALYYAGMFVLSVYLAFWHDWYWMLFLAALMLFLAYKRFVLARMGVRYQVAAQKADDADKQKLEVEKHG